MKGGWEGEREGWKGGKRKVKRRKIGRELKREEEDEKNKNKKEWPIEQWKDSQHKHPLDKCKLKSYWNTSWNPLGYLFKKRERRRK